MSQHIEAGSACACVAATRRTSFEKGDTYLDTERRMRGGNVPIGLGLLIVVSAACADSPTPPETGVRTDAIWRSAAAVDVREIEERQAVRLAELELKQTGSIRAGTPIALSAEARAKFGGEVSLSITALDVADDASGTRDLGRWQLGSSMARQARATSVIFERPGYYRVIATAVATGAIPDSLRNRDVDAHEMRTLWILVEADGGRLTDGYDPEAAKGRRLRYGAYGEFIPVDFRQPRAFSGRPTMAASMSNSSIAVFGTFRYFNSSTTPTNVNSFVPVRGGKIQATCVGRSTEWTIAPDIEYPITRYVAANGSWSVVCPDGVAFEWDYVSGNIYLDGVYADVRNHTGASVATGFIGYADDNLTVNSVSNAQAHAHSILEEYIPAGNSAFGRSRSKLTVRVHDTDSSYIIKYDIANDRLQLNPDRLFNIDGFFVVLHEFAHAFHWVAIEPPRSYSYSGLEHSWSEIEHISAAFAEGFANAYVAIVGGSFLTDGHPGADFEIENQTYHNIFPDSVSGWRIEGAVAGFLYDLVDNSSSPNSSANSSTGADDDSASYSASVIADVIANCNVTRDGMTLASIDGIDEFIYCAEKSISAQAELHPVYSKFFFKLRRDSALYTNASAGSHSLSASIVRGTWLKNLFGQ